MLCQQFKGMYCFHLHCRRRIGKCWDYVCLETEGYVGNSKHVQTLLRLAIQATSSWCQNAPKQDKVETSHKSLELVKEPFKNIYLNLISFSSASFCLCNLME